MLAAVLAAFGVALLIAAPLVAYARRHRPRAELPTLGRDIRVPRSLGVPTAYREAHPEVWCEREDRP